MMFPIKGLYKITFVLCLGILLSFASAAKAQVPVQVGPEPQTQFLDMAGAPLAGGIVCTYQAGTSTPLGTYTDSTGSVLNSNPVVLDSAGRANIWWQSAAYKVVLAGGGTCASPSNLQWTVDGFQIGVFLNGTNTWTGVNTFSNTTNFNGPVNLNDGGSMNGTFSGNPNFSGSPTFSGTIVASQFQSTVSTGSPPLIVASTTLVPNLNVQNLNGCVLSGTASAGQFIQASSASVCGWATATAIPSTVYNTPSASVNANIGATTMATPSVDATYRMSWYATITVIGGSCVGSTLLTVDLNFQDPNESSPSNQGLTTGGGFKLTNSGNGALGRAFDSGASTQLQSFTFRAKGGVAIQYSTTYTIGSSCSPGPKYQFYPVLEQVTSN